MSFTPEALYIIGSCDEQDNKKIFMSSPACADGYDTPAQQREDSTTFVVSIDSDQRPAPRRFAASPALHAPTHLDTLVEPDWLTVPILSLLRQCLGTIGVQGATLTHPDNEVALESLRPLSLVTATRPVARRGSCDEM